jgi:hypothetical protein
VEHGSKGQWLRENWWVPLAVALVAGLLLWIAQHNWRDWWDAPRVRADIGRYYDELARGDFNAFTRVSPRAREARWPERREEGQTIPTEDAFREDIFGEDRYLATYHDFGSVSWTGDARGRLAVRHLVSVRAKSGCARWQGGEFPVRRSPDHGWQIASFDDLGASHECSCQHAPWPTTPVGQIGRAPPTAIPDHSLKLLTPEEWRGRVAATPEASSSAPTSAQTPDQEVTVTSIEPGNPGRPVRVDDPENLDLPNAGTGVGATVWASFGPEAVAPTCIDFNLGHTDGPRVADITVTTEWRSASIHFADAPGVQWHKDLYGGTRRIEVTIDRVYRADPNITPPLEIAIWHTGT